jgi:hypothetical protein
LGLLAPAVRATSFIIDDFSQPNVGQVVSIVGTGSVSNTTTGLPGVVGGSRTMQIDVLASQFGLSSSLNVNAIGLGTLSLGNDSGQNGVGTVTWDANGAGLGGVDLTNGGALPYLQSRILASDLDLGFTVDITETAAAGGATASWTTDLGPGVSYVNRLLTDFTNSANVDFTAVDKIVLTLFGPSAQDATLDNVEITNTPGVDGVVPEPFTLLTVFAGMCSLGTYMRRRVNA